MGQISAYSITMEVDNHPLDQLHLSDVDSIDLSGGGMVMVTAMVMGLGWWDGDGDSDGDGDGDGDGDSDSDGDGDGLVPGRRLFNFS